MIVRARSDESMIERFDSNKIDRPGKPREGYGRNSSASERAKPGMTSKCSTSCSPMYDFRRANAMQNDLRVVGVDDKNLLHAGGQIVVHLVPHLRERCRSCCGLRRQRRESFPSNLQRIRGAGMNLWKKMRHQGRLNDRACATERRQPPPSFGQNLAGLPPQSMRQQVDPARHRGYVQSAT